MTTITPPVAAYPHRRRFTTVATVTLALVGSLLVAPALTASPASAADPLPDGSSAATAAASCWEVKQNVPAAPSGVYWLLTPTLKAPQQFYCDQVTDGGGWVLIARGRDGWKGQSTGLRSAVTLRNTVTGTGAFLVAQLPATTVMGLLDNTRVDALQDGVRVRRTTTADGSAWQEVRFKYQSRDRWTWTFGAEHRVASYSFDGVTGSGGQTSSFGLDNALRRVDTSAPSGQGFVGGIAYGSGVAGTNSPTTYLYSSTNGGGNARPFAQMYLRPKLLSANLNFGSIPDSGTSAIAQSVLPQSDAIQTVWGVTGLTSGSGELSTEVAAFGQVGNTVYVGGNFRYVQRSATSTGADRVDQPYIAGFDADTGELVTTFRPTLNGQVKAIAGLPDGRLAIGGQFSTVNGASRVSLAILDPVTGATSGWQVGIENRISGQTAQVRGLSVQGSKLYLAGAFTHLTAAGKTTAFARAGARIELSTGTPDTNWNPNFNGTSIGIDAADQGDRTYYSGYFKQSGTVQAISAAAVQTTAGAPLATPSWTPSFSKPGTNYSGNVWQLGIAEGSGHVWVGGSEHSLFGYDRTNFALTAGNITKNGGDFQTVSTAGDLVFGGCHCGDWTYQNAYSWDNIGTNWVQGDKISLMGAWNASTGAYQSEFNPLLQARAGYGIWATFTDSNGTLWAGGDIDHSVRAGEVNQWAGGFTRFAPRDSSAPTPPGGYSTAVSGDTATLSWNASSDNRAVTAYEIIRGNRVIASQTGRSYTVPVTADATRYFVRAVDAAGNRSASTAVSTVQTPAVDPHAVTLVETGSTWRWRYDSAAWTATWNQPGFDDSAWASGAAPLGFGVTGIPTDISVGAPSPRPLSAQFRTTFDLADASVISDASLTVIANDGAVVYVNGAEVGRANLPTGTLTQNSYATAAPRNTAASATPAVFTVPSSLLVDGSNVVAVSTHLNYRTTPDVSFDLGINATSE